MNKVGYLVQAIKGSKILALSILGLFLFIAAIFKIIISPTIEKTKDYQRELVSITNSSLVIEKARLEYPDMDKAIELLKKRRAMLIRLNKERGDFLAAAQNVIKELENNGVQISSFKYLYDLKEPLEAGYKKYGLQLKLTTDFSKLVKFLKDAERKRIMFKIGRIKITKISKNLLNIELRVDFIIKEKA